MEIARQALAAGDAVVATARNPERVAAALEGHGQRLLALPLDVTDEHRAQHVAAAAVDRFGRIDVLVNNAGRGLFGAVEETTPEEARAVFDTNVFAVLSVTRAVLPVMRRQRTGHLLAISSMGGFSAGARFGAYAASKFALEALHEAMHEELAPFGVKVTIVEPGVLATGFATAGSGQVAHPIDDYASTLPTYGGEEDDDPAGDPAAAAAAIRAVTELADPPLRLPIGRDAIARMRAKLAHVAADLDTAGCS
ncbi:MULTISPECIES: SDR family NAD(P)-dependent oxidoreductase [Amycolatopsis]|uniref:Short-chain dehydrogenase/reductase n=1 Tax=Amycolatopsis bullii TaxID=941987 RepID=A0ABQ3KR14_9PSEU|nr:SDR family NAD(P)-dependent oxidoreductase [Amycolatopsis bullii]GHG45502.1 short-chain dehydrogenase/reductase [Amycolatopsis bullii]